MKLYPLQFRPEMKERIWGGRALEQFGFTLPTGAIGEAWMIGDHPNGTTKVMNGELADWRLDQVCEQYGSELFGTKGFSKKNGRFPLLIKLLDCEDDLSVQVHPDDHYEHLAAGEIGKTEMWYILAAKPRAKIVYGMKEGVTRESLAKAIEENRIMECLQEVPVEAGDCFYIPAGTVHSLGAGVLAAEIQQNSDTTYRLYDYNRPGLDGKLRDLHIEDALNVIVYEGSGSTRMKTNLSETRTWLTLVQSPYFLVEKGLVGDDKWEFSTTPESFVILVIAEGGGSLSWTGGEFRVKSGDCYLLPANLGWYALEGRMTVIRTYLP